MSAELVSINLWSESTNALLFLLFIVHSFHFLILSVFLNSFSKIRIYLFV